MTSGSLFRSGDADRVQVVEAQELLQGAGVLVADGGDEVGVDLEVVFQQLIGVFDKGGLGHRGAKQGDDRLVEVGQQVDAGGAGDGQVQPHVGVQEGLRVVAGGAHIVQGPFHGPDVFGG